MHYIVTGRVSGDDEDSLYLYECANAQEAMDKMTEDLRQRLRDDHEEDADEADIYINWVVECDTKPRICNVW